MVCVTFLWYICLMILYATKTHLVGVVQLYKCSKKIVTLPPGVKEKSNIQGLSTKLEDRWIAGRMLLRKAGTIKIHLILNSTFLACYWCMIRNMLWVWTYFSIEYLLKYFLLWFLFIMAKYSLDYSLHHIHLRKNFTSWFTFFSCAHWLCLKASFL